jgi:ABC-2 type transport system ATP-binding protein
MTQMTSYQQGPAWAPELASAASYVLVHTAASTQLTVSPPVADGADLLSPRERVFGFLGPNGAGKTTTVRMLGTLIAPTSGSAVVAGLPVNPANAGEIRQRIAVMPEMPGLYQRLTVTENLEFFARLYGLPDREARIGAALEAVRLSDRADDRCGSLSKGLRQRVALAGTLVSEPEVLFLDEPTSGLDPAASHDVLGLIGSLRDRGVTVFLTTHRLDEAERLCDRVAFMNTTLRTVGRPAKDVYLELIQEQAE